MASSGFLRRNTKVENIDLFRVSESNLEDHLAYTWASTRLVRDAVYEVIKHNLLLVMMLFEKPALKYDV